MGLDDIQKFYTPKETRYLTHNFHPYPNKFIPQTARTLIKKYSNENDTVLDPFSGSGTSLLEANLLKRNAIGIDLNPLACLIARVKTTPLYIDRLKNAIWKLEEQLCNQLKIERNLNDYIDKINPKIPDFPKQDFWFQENALFGLGVLKELINKIEDIDIKNFCLVAFSSIIKDISDASSLYRLTKLKKPKKILRLDVLDKFGSKINQMISALEEYNQKHNPNFIKVYQKDSRYLKNKEKEDWLSYKNSGQLLLDTFIPKKEKGVFSNDSIDFIITNPPSFNFNFYRCFGIYFWWLNLGNIKELDKIMIGTKKINSKLIKLNIDFADEIIEKVRERKSCVGIALSKYYYDIKLALTQMHRLLRSDKYCCINCSDSILYGSPMRIPDTFIELANQVGFKLEKRIRRIIPKKALIFAKEDKVEEYLIFRKVK